MADRCHAFLDIDWRVRNGRNVIKRAILFMSSQHSSETSGPTEDQELLGRRWFLQSVGKWSGAAIAAAIVGSAWLASPPAAQAGAWVNRRAGGGVGGWVNRGGASWRGGGWINGGGGGGGWINRRYYGGGGAWINRW